MASVEQTKRSWYKAVAKAPKVNPRPRKNILQSRAAIAHSIDDQIAGTRKVSERDAKIVAAKTVGKYPQGRQRAIVRNGTTGLSKREIEEVRTKQPVKKIKTAIKPITGFAPKKPLSMTPKRTFKKTAPAKKTIKVGDKELQRGTLTKAKPNERQIKMMRADVSATDIKNLVELRTARAQKKAKPLTKAEETELKKFRAGKDDRNRIVKSGKTIEKRLATGAEKPSRTQLPYHSERESAELENSASKQWRDAKRTVKVSGESNKPTDVQNPMGEKAAVRQAEGIAADAVRKLKESDKRQDAADKKRGITKLKVKVRQKVPAKKSSQTVVFTKRGNNNGASGRGIVINTGGGGFSDIERGGGGRMGQIK